MTVKTYHVHPERQTDEIFSPLSSYECIFPIKIYYITVKSVLPFHLFDSPAK